VLPLIRPCVSVTGPTEETPCVHTGLSAAEVVTTTAAMRAPTRTRRSSLATRRPVTIADPVFAATVVITAPVLRQLRGRPARFPRLGLTLRALKVDGDLAEVTPRLQVVFDKEGEMATRLWFGTVCA